MQQVIGPPNRLRGTISLPGDKSISQRALLLNAIAEGTAHVSNLCAGDDRESILRCLRGLGVSIVPCSRCSTDGNVECFEVQGRGLNGLQEPEDVLDAGNSGTAMRLLAGLLSGQPFLSVLSGDSSLRSRPMDRVVRPLVQMGAQIMGRGGGSLAPLSIRGGDLQGISYTLPVASAQVKSCLLIAGLYAAGGSTIMQPALSRDHTERLLRAMGADLREEGLELNIAPSSLSPVDVRVPGDISSSAFWLVAACCHPDAEVRIEGVGVNPSRAGILEALRSMGASVRLENVREEGDEPVADLVAESSELVGTEVAGSIVPQVIDEIPVLAVAASVARGTTVIRDAAELRVKESDRIRSTVEGLTALGAVVEERPDGMVIEGVGGLKGGSTVSNGDHRIAMAMAVAGLVSSGDTVIGGAEAAGVSYPGFWDVLESISEAGERPAVLETT